MIFNSFQYLFFFPFVVLIYFILPFKVRYIWLLVASYYFYMCWNYKYALLMALSTLITYISGILIDKADSIVDIKKRALIKKLYVFLSLFLNLSILFFFKYWNFAATNINRVITLLGSNTSVFKFDFILPVGISFYTFQALSYTLDVYRKDIYAERNFLKYALFVSFFPQLVAGPIERSRNLLQQISVRHDFNFEESKIGFFYIFWGLFQKIVLADRIAILVDQVYNDISAYDGIPLIIATLLFAIQIYCDFAGYSSIAIGSAKILGFRLMENFNAPYFSDSVGVFWRRWHISLSSWFRDYLYFPLGGSRCSNHRKAFNKMVTFLVSGLWHGASWTYVIWGGLNGLYQVISDYTQPLRMRLKKVFRVKDTCWSYKMFQIVITFLLVDFTWIFFRARSFREACSVIYRIFTRTYPWQLVDGTLFKLGLDWKDMVVMILGIFALFVVDFWRNKVSIIGWLNEQNFIFRCGIYYAMIFIPIIFGVYGIDASASQFIYFQF